MVFITVETGLITSNRTGFAEDFHEGFFTGCNKRFIYGNQKVI
jgi:hypothetical protein